MILNDKEQSTSQNVANTTIEVVFPQNKKLKLKSTHIKEKSKKSRELVYLCDICHQDCQENLEIALNVANMKDGLILAV